jgi:hypothetical protein
VKANGKRNVSEVVKSQSNDTQDLSETKNLERHAQQVYERRGSLASHNSDNKIVLPITKNLISALPVPKEDRYGGVDCFSLFIAMQFRLISPSRRNSVLIFYRIFVYRIIK